MGSCNHGVARLESTGWTPLGSTGLPTGKEGANTGDPTAIVHCVKWLTYDPVHPEDLYAWVEGHGVFRFDRPTNSWRQLGAGGPMVIEF